jgi:hypothetical protein
MLEEAVPATGATGVCVETVFSLEEVGLSEETRLFSEQPMTENAV